MSFLYEAYRVIKLFQTKYGNPSLFEKLNVWMCKMIYFFVTSFILLFVSTTHRATDDRGDKNPNKNWYLNFFRFSPFTFIATYFIKSDWTFCSGDQYLQTCEFSHIYIENSSHKVSIFWSKIVSCLYLRCQSQELN